MYSHHIDWDIDRCDDFWSPPKVTPISPACLVQITQNCPQLTHLNMSGTITTAEELQKILAGPSIKESLTSLNISFCIDRAFHYPSTSVDLEMLAPLVPNLRVFSSQMNPLFKQRERDDDLDPEAISARLTTVLAGWPNLESLWLSGSVYGLALPNLSMLKSLSSLNTSDLADFTNIMPVASTLTALTPINLGFGALNGESMRDCFEVATNLRVLHEASGPGLEILKMLPSLEEAHFLGSKFLEAPVDAETPRFDGLKKLAIRIRSEAHPSIKTLAYLFPRLQSLNLRIFPETCRLTTADVAHLGKLPFLRSLHLSSGGFSIAKPADLTCLENFRALENLWITMTPPVVGPFLSRRYPWSPYLRKLSLYITDKSTFFPELLPLTKNSFVEHASTVEKKPKRKRRAATFEDSDEEGEEPLAPLEAIPENPSTLGPLFPCLGTLAISKVACLSRAVWLALSKHICPNIHTIYLNGDISFAREFPVNEDDPVDNVNEEGKTEEIVGWVLELFPRVRTIFLVDAWKDRWVQPAKTREMPRGYITKKVKFMSNLRNRGIAVFVQFEVWATYSGFRSFSHTKHEQGEPEPSKELYL